MATAEVRFMGIHRDTNEGLSPDGECMQLIGATATEDGIKMLEVPKEEHYVSGSFTNIKWFAKGNCYLAIDSAKHLVRFTEQANNSSEQAINSSEQANNPTELEAILTAYVEQDEQQVGIEITGYETVGNMICCFTDDGIYYVLRSGEGDSEEYKQLGYGLPYPTLYVSDMEQKVFAENSTMTYSASTLTLDEIVTLNASWIGLWNKSVRRAHDDGYLIDRAFFRVGIRMYDGTLVNISPIVCAEPPFAEYKKTRASAYLRSIDEGGFDASDQPSHYLYSRDSASAEGLNYNTSSNLWDYCAGVFGFKPVIKVVCPNLSDYGDLISAIEVYTTGSVLRTHEATKFIGPDGTSSESKELSFLDTYSSSSYKQNVQNALYRKCMVFDANMMKKWEIDTYSQDNLQVQDALTDSLINSHYKADISYVYNKRLHIANYTELLSVRQDLSLSSGMIGLVDSSGFSRILLTTSQEPGTPTEFYGKHFYRVKSLDKVYNGTYYYQAWCRKRADTNTIVCYYTSTTMTTGALDDMGGIAPTSGSTLYDASGTDTYYRTSGDVETYQSYNEGDSVQSDRRSALFDNGTILQVKYDTSDGEKEIVKSLGGSCYMPVLELMTNSAFSVSDARAISATLYQQRQGFDHDSRSFALEKIEGYNVSLQFAPRTNYVVTPTVVPDANVPSFNDPIELSASDVLKVSGLDNPLVFPSRQTYQLDGTIVGMQANTEELGEGQHGENPLYVFTDVGTWAMFVDKTGQTVYPYTDAVSGDVLSGDVVSLPDGIVMVTSRGLMMLRGKQRTLLSGALEGEDSWLLPELTVSGEGLAVSGGDAMVRKVTAVSLIADAAKVRGERFREYLQECRLGYDYVHGLLYVSREDRAYTYVYNLASGEWSKMAVSVKDWVSVWPKCVFTVEEAVSGEGLAVNVRTELWTTDNMAVENSKLLLISRPVKVARGLKKLDQFALEGFIRQSTEEITVGSEEPATGDSDARWEDYGQEIDFEGETMSGAQRLCVYVLGSLDGLSYQLAGACATGKPSTRMVGRFLRTNAYRYFIVCVVGGLKTNSIVNDVVLDVAEAYNRRLR